ncbi:hypothetical protein ABE571_17405 [Stenotrophomonas sp. TWI273]|uniref:hypothetical protein n=1 Tax=Stenotrophomonas sp. TWI273 TaxID=3136774 RepID=UPI00320824DA
MSAPQPALAQAARYRHPFAGWPGRALQRLLGCVHLTAARRALTRVLPVPTLISEVREVVYLSWWVDVRHAPPPPPDHRLFAHDGRTPYTILTYRHGHFGPALAGPLRGLFPSPLQSNWRWYVVPDDAAAGPATPRVLFDRNVIDSAMHAVGARLWSDAMQPHLAARFEHAVDADGGHTVIEPGQGSAPALQAKVRPAMGLAVAWAAGAFTDAAQAMRFLACQEAAFAVAPDGRLALTHIDLPIAVADVQPLQLEGLVACPHLAAMGVDLADAFCFRVPQVPFRVVSERLL